MMEEAASSALAVEIRGVTKSFGNQLVLRGIDLEVKRGEFLVVFGPNGAGKTTLIKILATILNPSSGKILIDSLNLKDKAEEIRRRIGVVTHQTFLYPNLTAFENLEFYSRLYDISRGKERIDEVTVTMEMTSRLDDQVATLSRGMQQRLSIARSLLHQPTIMLLDEPETGLDQKAIGLLWEAIRKDERGKRTIILTTHNLERGLELCDQVAILVSGRIVFKQPKQGLKLTDLIEAYQQNTGADR